MPARSTRPSGSIRRRAAMAALLVASASLPAIAQPTPTPRAANAAATEELLLEVDVNNQRLDATALLLRTPDGQFWATEVDIRKWRLRVPDASPLERGGSRYAPLSAIAGVTLAFDAARQRLALTAPPAAFIENTLSTERGPYPAP